MTLLWISLLACGGSEPEAEPGTAPVRNVTGPPVKAPTAEDDGADVPPPDVTQAKPRCGVGGAAILSGDLGDAIGCAVEGGVVKIPVTVPPHVTVGVQDARVVGGVIEIDLRPSIWDSPLPEGPAALVVPPVTVPVSLTTDGGRWDGEITVDPGVDVLVSAVEGGTDGLGHRDPSDDARLAAFHVDDAWHFVGEGATVGDVDLFLIPDEQQGAPTPIDACVTADGTEVPTVAVPMTFQAVGIEGNQVARTRLAGRTTCPAEPVLPEGETTLTLGPDAETIRPWAEKLLKRR